MEVALAQVFFSSILPVFAVALIGFIAAKRAVFDAASASVVNKFVFMIAMPALLFRLVSGAPIDAFPWDAALGYLAVEIVIIAIGALIARKVFRRSLTESFLLGMAAGFSNHVIIILPIMLALYGEVAVRPVVAIIMIDALIVFSAFILILDLAASDGKQGAVRRLASALFRNPPVIAMIAGLVVALLGVPIPEGVNFFTQFLGNAAPPAALFALGVVLASRSDKPEIAAPIIFTALKLLAMPALIWLLFNYLAPIEEGQARVVLLASTAPCGAMPFVLALQFGAPTATIARAILISTTLSAFLISAAVTFLGPV